MTVTKNKLTRLRNPHKLREGFPLMIQESVRLFPVPFYSFHHVHSKPFCCVKLLTNNSLLFQMNRCLNILAFERLHI